MPPRIARGSVSVGKQRAARKKVQKRALNALSIADHEVQDRPRIAPHRYGEADDDQFRGKRRRVDDEAGESEDDAPAPHYRPSKDRHDEDLNIPDGEDSEGNEWRLGHVDEDNDSDLDSDEAFDESDEELFEGFTFRGSSSNPNQKAKRPKTTRVATGDDNVLEEDSDGEASGSDEDDLGEDAVELAAMLDEHGEDNSSEDGNGEEDSRADSDGFSEADEPDDADGLANLKKFVSSLPQEGDKESWREKPRYDDIAQPEKVASKTKLSIDDMLAGVDMPSLKKSRKLLHSSKKPSHRNGIPGKLEAPLPKRQQDRLDRAVADKKANETLGRWVDTVKQNRRAEHVSFPLVDPSAAEPSGTRRLRPAAPQTALESAIDSIMRESGLAVENGQDDEDQLREFEELQMNKMPLEEVQARRAQLRMARDLMFREELRSRRIKKIKSKAYRRVHRKERERAALKEADLYGEPSDDERERRDRQRAKERVGAKHRDSKWAKSMKQTGRAAWDDDARDGVTDMARRNEELRRRQQGKDVDQDFDGLSTSDDDEDLSDLDSDGAREALLGQLSRIESPTDQVEKGLGAMKFMKNARAARKAQNDEAVRQLKRELAGEDGHSDNDSVGEDNASGRRKYGPQTLKPLQGSLPKQPKNRSEFEEVDRMDSDEEAGNDDVGIVIDNGRTNSQRPTTSSSVKEGSKSIGRKGITISMQAKVTDGSNLKRNGSKKSLVTSPSVEVVLDPSLSANGPAAFKPQSLIKGSGTNDDDAEDTEPTLSRNEQLVQQAFGDVYTEQDFAKEKAAVTQQDDEQVIDNALSGWGTWTGVGVSKRVQNRHKGKFLTKKEGIKPQDRKDANLKNVIINEKRIKKNGAYLASALPFPFSTKAEYERSMRMPVGGEWNTKVTHQDSVKPRVLVKAGRVIAPIEKPLL